MIEFELKFKIIKLPIGFKNLNCKKTFSETDNYYDTHNNCLIKNGNFLRLRNDYKIDFKLDIGDDFHLYCKETSFTKDSINSKNNEFIKIFKYLKIEINTNFNSFNEFIKKNNFNLIAPICKTRSVYAICENMNVTVDSVNCLGDFVEIEMMFDDNINLDNKIKIKNDIISILKNNDLYFDDFLEQQVGYVELYLKENNPAIYELGKFKV